MRNRLGAGPQGRALGANAVTSSHRNIKIVATLGPASSDNATILRLAQSGVNVFRLNMRHGSHDTVRKMHAAIRTAEDNLQRPIGILADLQGPKIRCGVFADGPKLLERGTSFRFDLDKASGSETRVTLPHPEIFAALRPGASVLVNDGKIRLRVIDNSEARANCEVVVGGEISDRKGVNLPDVVLPLSAPSEKGVCSGRGRNRIIRPDCHGFGRLYSPVRRMCAHPSGEICPSNSGEQSNPSADRCTTAWPS